MVWWNTLFGKLITTFAVAMIPVVELRGAIPFGVARGLGLWQAIIVSIVGNLVPVPFIILFIRKIFAWLRKIHPRFNALVTRLETRAESKSDKVMRYAFWGLFVLVAIPLPGTGAWTGALVALTLNLKLRESFPAIALGVVSAGVIVSVASYIDKIAAFVTALFA